MSVHTDMRKKTKLSPYGITQPIITMTALYFYRLLNKCNLASAAFTIDEVNRVIGVLEINSYEVRSRNGCGARGLFPVGALLSHGCISNAQCNHAHEKPYMTRSVSPEITLV